LRDVNLQVAFHLAQGILCEPKEGITVSPNRINNKGGRCFIHTAPSISDNCSRLLALNDYPLYPRRWPKGPGMELLMVSFC